MQRWAATASQSVREKSPTRQEKTMTEVMHTVKIEVTRGVIIEV